MTIRIAARKSDLARLQAYQVGQALESLGHGPVQYQFRESLGDINLHDPLWKMPERGVFTQDFVHDLKTGACDLVVHSWKDLPIEPNPGTMVVATLPRADPRDILLFKNSSCLKKSTQLKLGSSSPRRQYNLESLLPTLIPWQVEQLKFEPIRGNIQTRLRKFLADQSLDGLVMAKAALDRILSVSQEEFLESKNLFRQALSQLHWMILPLSQNPTAAAQGALAIEIAEHRLDLKKILGELNHQATFEQVNLERKILSKWGGGCHQKIGISVVDHPQNLQIQSLKGLTDQGQVLNEFCIVRPQIKRRVSASHIWAYDQTVECFQRRSLSPTHMPTGPVFVAKAEALAPTMKPTPGQWLWTSGLKTWQNLAKRGHWVWGTQDSLGEDFPMGIQCLAEGPVTWTKLTHSSAPPMGEQKNLATYELVPMPLPPYQGEKYFYWMSGTQFDYVTKVYPEILTQAWHACGLGHTYHHIKNRIDPQRLEIFISRQDWQQSFEIIQK